MVTAFTLLLVMAGALHAQTRVRRGEAAETPPNPRGVAQPQDTEVELPGPELIPRGLDRPVNPDTYVLGPSDQLVLIVRGSEQRELKLTVLPEGTLILPNRGPIKVAGMTITEFRNQAKADLLYGAIDTSPFYANPVAKPYRSWMNVPFTLAKPELDGEFLVQAEAAGLTNLKGHRSVGGMRASIYNAMPVDGVQALVDFMAAFESENA